MQIEETTGGSRKGLLIDTTQCLGCGACVAACRRENNLPGGPADKLSFKNYTVVNQYDSYYVRKLCMHCEIPTCVSVCPVGALSKRESGAVVWDESKCFGCRYCMLSCPFQVPTFEWLSYNPRIRKCILCYERIEAGRPTACAEACPTEATLFGERDTLIQVAMERIQSHRDRYQNHLIGLTEVGGTSVMYMSAIPFDKLGFSKDIFQRPLSETTWRILEQVPNIVLLGAWVLGGFYWIYRRRTRVQSVESHAAGTRPASEGGHDDAK